MKEKREEIYGLGKEIGMNGEILGKKLEETIKEMIKDRKN